jgi:hypothetical protein
VRSTVLLAARSSLIAFLAVGLMNLPVMAASAKPLGTVVTAQNAHLDNVNAAIGAAVYSGDALVTDEGGSLRVALGTAQLYLLSSSSATLAPQENSVQATLSQGTVGFSTSKPAQFEMETPLGLVRGSGSNPVFGQVSLTGPASMRISAYEGTLVVDGKDGEEKTIAPGETYDASLVPPGDEKPPKVGVTGTGINWKHVAAVAIPAGVLALAAVLIWHYVCESNSVPTS